MDNTASEYGPMQRLVAVDGPPRMSQQVERQSIIGPELGNLTSKNESKNVPLGTVVVGQRGSGGIGTTASLIPPTDYLIQTAAQTQHQDFASQ